VRRAGIGAFLSWLVLAAGCATPQPPYPAADIEPRLAGITWRFVEFRSSDDAIGVIKPTNPADYTMTLGNDGQASLHLNCNQASGAWTAQPSSDDSGSFSLGPLAMTRVFCPQPSLDVQIARHAEYMRTFLLRDGRLYIDLMADGGTYVWEPAARP
jgi:heat shock protein HslJ